MSYQQAGDALPPGHDTTAWQVYAGQVTVDVAKRGAASFDYYSVATAGYTEATQTEARQ